MSKPSPSSSLSRAGELLASNGRRMLLVEAILLCLPTVGAYILLGRVYALLYTAAVNNLAAFAWLTGAYILLLCGLTLFAALPQLYGFLQLCREAAHGGTPAPTELFSGFCSGSAYRRMLALSWRAFFRMLCLAGAIALTRFFTAVFFGEHWLGALVSTLCVIAACLIWLAVVLHGFGGAFAALERIDRPLLKTHGGARFALVCLPRVLLGFLTLGIYLLWDVIPRIGVAYFDYCRQLQPTQPTEEYKNHE